jgi:hypothetical protein
LLKNAKIVKRILASAESSFEKYDEIFSAAYECAGKEVLVLCSLGVCATCLPLI